MNELLKKKGTNFFFPTLKTMTLYNNPIVQSSLQSLLEPSPEGLTFCAKPSVYLFKGTYSLINSLITQSYYYSFFFFFLEQITKVINYTEKVIYLLAEQIELILSLSESCLMHRDMLNFTQLHTLPIPSDGVTE